MKKTTAVCFLFFLLAVHFVQGQVNDAQLWENINIEKKLTQRLLVRINHEGRITENITRPSFYYFDIGATYKLNKHLHITLAYVWGQKRQLTEFWSTHQQAYAAFTLRKKIHRFQFNDRVMLLGQVKDYLTSRNGKDIDYYIRNKITIRYDKSFRYAPYLASELYFLANKPDQFQYHFNRIRYFAGIFYRPNLVNEFEVYYLIERRFNTADAPTDNNFDDLNAHHNWVIGIGYSHRF